MTTNTENRTAVTVLVTAGTGKVGRRVANELSAKGIDVRIGARSAQLPFDWDNRDTWSAVLEGVDAAFLMYTPDIGDPRAAETIRAFSAQAVAAGVRRLVLLSARGETQAEPAEAAVRESGAEWTVLQAAWFNQNFDEGAFTDMIHGGALAFPAGQVLEPFVDAEDLAAVAVLALTQDGHAGHTYDLTGPRLLSFGDAVQAIAAATGREIHYIPVSGQEFGAVLKSEFGMPDPEVAGMIEIFATLLDGRNAHVTDTVRRLLGRDPIDFADYVRDASAAGAWKLG
ncbi:NAD(P)H-binding protein [Nocardia sp. 2]|uniref:NAD(P)H-binding protein n=1 Tax=Nocardia acididurans TaxID=2802282 RepID=A0ABS1MAP6_9NOCA|nr:NAD(P)H-binding protein [Nocardia acididurans]MBL1077115.1 NAD(P)H-binding protein [Nocardia acididurans]